MQTVPTLPLIPTRYKQKVFHTHSWPIGAEAMSKALAGIPQFDQLELTFAATWAFQSAATKYAVMHVRYQRRLRSFSDGNAGSAHDLMELGWGLHICPIPRSQRHAIQTRLIEEGLPLAKKWLTDNTAGNRPGKTSISLFYDEEQGTMTHEVERSLEPERI